MINIYMIRNAETSVNKHSKLQGHTESSLSSIGKKQAKLLTNILKNIDFDKIYISPLNRAIETYSYTGLKFETTKLDILKERNFGNLNGLKYQEIINKHPEYRPRNGESLTDILNRSNRFLEYIIHNNFNQKETINILVFSHHEMILSCIANILELPINNFRNIILSNASITQLVYEDKRWLAKRINEIGHLGQLDTTKKFD